MISDSGTNFNVVAGNLIGTNATGHQADSAMAATGS